MGKKETSDVNGNDKLEVVDKREESVATEESSADKEAKNKEKAKRARKSAKKEEKPVTDDKTKEEVNKAPSQKDTVKEYRWRSSRRNFL